MGSHRRTSLVLGLLVLAFAIFVALVWVPMVSASGMIENVRRRVVIDDALAPTLAAVFLGLGGLLVALFERDETPWQITRQNLGYLAAILLILIASFAVMRWLGPFVAGALTEEGYRTLRDTAPWKYLGFLVGGAGMIAGMIIYVEGQFTLRSVLIGLATALALIAVYDLPFDDLLLPPNGDV